MSEIDESCLQGYCPKCGALPGIAKLRREDGKRILQCNDCNTQWPFMRIKCVYCGTENQDDLRFFSTDDESPYRVDVCDKCKGYIKTVDERKVAEGKEIDLLAENKATLYLDILAMEEGYQKMEVKE